MFWGTLFHIKSKLALDKKKFFSVPSNAETMFWGTLFRFLYLEKIWKKKIFFFLDFLEFLSLDNSETWWGYVSAVALWYKNGPELEFAKKIFFFSKFF